MGAIVNIDPKGERYRFLRLGPGWIYAERNGRAVLRDETSWRKISGLWVNTPWGCYWFMFRRRIL
jgi:hypothetical protein